MREWGKAGTPYPTSVQAEPLHGSVTEQHGGSYYAAAVGGVNVTTKMKEVGALIGGEGNGGVIYPAAHYGANALVGMLFSYLYG